MELYERGGREKKKSGGEWWKALGFSYAIVIFLSKQLDILRQVGGRQTKTVAYRLEETAFRLRQHRNSCQHCDSKHLSSVKQPGANPNQQHGKF